MSSKLTTRTKLAEMKNIFSDRYYTQPNTIWGFTSGAFDILHIQHIKYLQQARKHLEKLHPFYNIILVVGINSDESIKALKGPNRPIVPEEERAEIIAALECVDFVFIFDEQNNNKNIETLEPDYYIKGGDYKPEQMTSTKLMKEWGGQALIIPPEDISASTTNIIDTILERFR